MRFVGGTIRKPVSPDDSQFECFALNSFVRPVLLYFYFVIAFHLNLRPNILSTGKSACESLKPKTSSRGLANGEVTL